MCLEPLVMSSTAAAGIIVGVDTLKHTHAAVAIDAVGARRGATVVPASLDGYRALDAWARSGRSASRAPAPTAPACPASCADRDAPSSRSTGPTARCDAERGRATWPTPRAPPGPC